MWYLKLASKFFLFLKNNEVFLQNLTFTREFWHSLSSHQFNRFKVNWIKSTVTCSTPLVCYKADCMGTFWQFNKYRGCVWYIIPVSKLRERYSLYNSSVYHKWMDCTFITSINRSVAILIIEINFIDSIFLYRNICFKIS